MANVGELRHSGFWSLSDETNLQIYTTTTEDNQEFIVMDEDGRNLHLNSVVFSSIDSPLFIKINDNIKLLPIRSGDTVEYTYQIVDKFTIIGSQGTHFMAYGQYF